MTTKEVARKFGVSVTTIYNWENKGILRPVRISPTGRRTYDEAQVQKVYDSEKMTIDNS